MKQIKNVPSFNLCKIDHFRSPRLKCEGATWDRIYITRSLGSRVTNPPGPITPFYSPGSPPEIQLLPWNHTSIPHLEWQSWGGTYPDCENIPKIYWDYHLDDWRIGIKRYKWYESLWEQLMASTVGEQRLGSRCSSSAEKIMLPPLIKSPKSFTPHQNYKIFNSKLTCLNYIKRNNNMLPRMSFSKTILEKLKARNHWKTTNGNFEAGT